eukprot:8514804-Lingulodinium_polyedra.AAC.1
MPRQLWNDDVLPSSPAFSTGAQNPHQKAFLVQDSQHHGARRAALNSHSHLPRPINFPDTSTAVD